MRKHRLSNWNNESERLHSEDSILQELEDRPDQTARELSYKLNTDVASIRKRLFTLEEQGLVERSSSFPVHFSLNRGFGFGSLEQLDYLLRNGLSHLGAGIMIGRGMKRREFRRWLKNHSTDDTEEDYKVFYSA